MALSDEVKTLHRNLGRKYKRHGSRVEQMWRSLNQVQRAKVLRKGFLQIPKSPTDSSHGNVNKLIPEWNLRDITDPSSDILLNMLKHRSTTSLQDQYKFEVNGGSGDHLHIMEVTTKKNLAHPDAHKLEDCYTLLFDEENFGKSVKVPPSGDKLFILKAMAPIMRAQLIVPQSTGDFILYRQQYLLQLLKIIIEDILEAGSTTRDQKSRPKKCTDTATAALSTLSFIRPRRRLGFPTLLKAL